MLAYVLLGISIVLEVVGTSLLKKAEGFSNAPITLALLACYSIAFFCLSIVVKTIPVGIVYATWSGVGILLVAAVGYFLYKQALDMPGMIGVALIIAGVLIINLFSKTSAH